MVILLLAYRVIGVVLTFVVSLIVAREFGAKGAGFYYIFLSLVAGLSLVATFGYDKAIIRFIGIFLAENKLPKIKGLWLQVLISSIVMSLFLTLLLLLNENFVLEKLFPSYQTSNVILIVCVSSLMLSIATINSGYLRGEKKPVLASFIDNILMPLVTIISLLIFVYAYVGANDFDVVLARFIAICVVCVVSLAAAYKSLAIYRIKYTKYSKLVEESWPLFGVGVVSFLIQWSATFIIALYMSEADVGIYNTALRVVLLVAMLNFVFNNINSPYFSTDYEGKNMDKLEARAQSTAAISSLAAIIFLVPLSVFADQVLSLFGDEFREGVVVLWILAIGQFISMSCGSVGYLLMMTGNGYKQRNINLIVLVVQLILLPVLVSKYGLIGAGIVSSVAVALNNLLSLYLASSVLKIKVWPDYKKLLQ